MADSQTIDQLAIEITSSIKGEKKLQTFTSALKDLARTTSTINTGKLTSTATAMKQFSNSISGMKTGNVKNLVNSLSRLSAVNPNLSGINGMTSAISHLASVSDKAKDLTGLANALGRIAKADMSAFNTGAFNSLTSSISTLANSLSATNNIDSNLTRLVTAIAKLSGSGQYINNVSTYLPTLGNALVKLTKDIAGVGTVDTNMSRLVDGIARLANAGAKAADSAKNLDALGDAVLRLLNKLKSAPAVNTNIANTINGLGNLAASGARFGSVSSGVASTGAVKFGNALKSLKDRLHHTNKSSKGLASTIGLLYAKFWLLKRAIQGIGNFVGYAQDYIEGFNYFNVAMQKIGEDSKDQFARFGYESADEYAKSFSGRFTKLQKQMSGFNVDTKTGNATFSGDKYLGVDLTAAQQYQAEIAQITNTTGQLGEVSIATSKAMSMLAADWSSLTNTDIVDVQENLRSGLIGMSRAVYKYGIDITNASLQQIAYNHNVSQSVAKMSNMSKQQLRIIGILEQSKIAYTDLARTINQPANQLRMLQAGFKNLARTIGQIFLPIVQKLYPYLNAVVMVLQEFVSWIAKLTGADLGGAVSAYKVPDIDYGDAADDTDAMADNTKKTAKNTKKIKDNIQSFDILNKLDKNDDTSSNPIKNTGDNGLANIDLSEDIQKLVDGYEKMWDKAFNSSKNKAVQLAKKMKKALLSAWGEGDFTKLGKKFGNWINKGIRSINTEKIKSLLEKIANSAATFLNGAIKKLKPKKIGKKFSDFVNAIINAGYKFLSKFNWLKFGKKLGKGVKSFIKNLDTEKYGRMLGAGIRGIVQAAWGFVGEFDFSNLGEKISDAINGFLDEMGEVDEKTNLSGWQELGQTISNSISGIADTLIVALDNVNWDAVGKAIGDFLTNIKWFEVLGKVGTVIAKAVWGLIKAGFEAFKENPLGMVESLSGALLTVFAIKKLASLLTGLKGIFASLFGSGVSGGISGMQTGSMAESLGSKISDIVDDNSLLSKLSGKFKSLGSKLGGAMVGAIAGSLAGEAAKDGDLTTAITTSLGTAIAAAATSNPLMAIVAGAAGWWNNTADISGGEYSKQIDDLTSKGGKHPQLKKIADYLKQEGVDDASLGKILNQTKSHYSKDELKDLLKKIEGDNKPGKRLLDELGYVKDTNSGYYVHQTKGQKETDKGAKTPAFDVPYKKYSKEHNQYIITLSKLKTTMNNLGITEKKQKDNISKINEALSNGKIKLADFVAVTNKNATSAGKFNKILSKLIPNVAVTNTTKYKNLTNQLKEKMTALNIPSKKQEKYINKIKESMDEGVTSLDDYKDIVDNSTDSTKSLNEAMDKIKDKEVKAKVSADTSEANSKINDVFDKDGKTITTKVDADTSGATDKIKNVTDPKEPYKPITFKTEIDKESHKTVKDQINDLTKKAFTIRFKEVIEQSKREHDSGGFWETHADLLNLRNALKNPNKVEYIAKTQTLKIPKEFYKSTATKAQKEVVEKAEALAAIGEILKIKKYKKGGILEDGIFTMNKGEIAGKFDNGRSVVANNEQITKGFAEGITSTLAPAIFSAVKQAINEADIGGDTPIYLDGVQITKNVQKHNAQMTRQRGKNPMLV